MDLARPTGEVIRDYFAQVTRLLAEVDPRDIERNVELFWECYRRGARLVVCGNGGSAATASHLVTDLQKNLLHDMPGRKPWETLCLAESMPLVTAWSNDTDYANVFAAQARCWLRPGDLLLAISGSGNSPNILAAAAAAREIGALTIGWSGYGGGKLAGVADDKIVLRSGEMQHVEDIHMVLAHTLFCCLREKLAAMPAGESVAATVSVAYSAGSARGGGPASGSREQFANGNGYAPRTEVATAGGERAALPPAPPELP